MLLRYMTVRRKPNGTLAIPAELRDGQRKRLEEVDSLLHEIKSEGLGLRHFIPNMEVLPAERYPTYSPQKAIPERRWLNFVKSRRGPIRHRPRCGRF